ncbi:MAG TPA: DinB family protein [Bryobacteraceae bacterium]|nr:DinB family protein [Bryobacteraceae bacterium]
MNRIRTLAVLASLSCAALMSAQDNPFSSDLKGAYTGIKNTLMRAAEKMPEEDYSFRTVPEVRTYGEMVTHIADVQFMLCGLAKGEQKKGEAPAEKTKAAASAYLKSSFDYCDGVYNSMTDSAGAAKVKMFGREMTKLGVLNFNIGHDNEMYGTMVAFLRIKGIVPPSSDRRP